MQNTQHQTPLGQLWNSIQSWLFPVLEDEIGALENGDFRFLTRPDAPKRACIRHFHLFFHSFWARYGTVQKTMGA